MRQADARPDGRCDMRPSRRITDFILMQFHTYVYTYSLIADSFRNAPDSHSLMKPVTVPVTRVLH